MKAYKKIQLWIFAHSGATAHSATITNGSDQILVLLLKMRPDRGGHWQPVTGSVEKGETLKTAALREGLEETGLTLDPARLLDLKFSFEFDSKWGHATEHAFAIPVFAGAAVSLDPNEHVSCEWVTPKVAFSKLSFDSNREVLNLLLNHLNASGASS